MAFVLGYVFRGIGFVSKCGASKDAAQNLELKFISGNLKHREICDQKF